MEVPRPELDRMTEGGVHQGLVLTVPDYKYADLKSIETTRCIIACDGLTDPAQPGSDIPDPPPLLVPRQFFSLSDAVWA